MMPSPCIYCHNMKGKDSDKGTNNHSCSLFVMKIHTGIHVHRLAKNILLEIRNNKFAYVIIYTNLKCLHNKTVQVHSPLLAGYLWLNYLEGAYQTNILQLFRNLCAEYYLNLRG